MTADWATKTIADVCSVVNGGTPKTGVSEYWDGTHQWITPAEMGKRSSPYVARTERTITDAGIQSSSARLLPPHSVILSSRAPIGHLVINTEAMATNQGCKGLVPSDGLNHKYLYYYLSSIVQLLNDLGTGATFKELSSGKLKEVPIPVPPLAEQQRIVAILDEAFETIAAARANAEQNRQNARALFESYLQSVFSQRGDRWVETTIGNQVDFLAGFAFKSTQYTESKDGIRLIRGDNIVQGQLRWDGVKYLPRASAENYSQFYFEENDIVLAMDRPWVAAGLKVAYITNNDLPALQVQRTARLRVKPNIHWKYLFHMIRSSKFVTYLLDGQTGLGVPHISGKQILSFEFAMPPLNQQQLIVQKLDALGDKTQRLESLYQRKIAALDELKQSLLQQAFSGQL
ncbi:restriction endonuclease subunit S [Plesiomonas shigelloides]|uniref:restriction endonuclease subunit S n=1 Tax=Plesiomonas shigelloides TaxID=703 RepID=UPI001262A7DD|nr:restriction endonuclease subunit S [Plesiomonas shigelloides]KAB7674901.1 restriction endonuclease subunit S [Plesiomonas shigelloides]